MPIDIDPTELIITAVALLAGLGLVAAMVIAERRPRTSLNPRMIPTTPVLFAGALVAIMAGIHLLGLLGLHK